VWLRQPLTASHMNESSWLAGSLVAVALVVLVRCAMKA
jgi:hypothetical protein